MTHFCLLESCSILALATVFSLTFPKDEWFNFHDYKGLLIKMEHFECHWFLYVLKIFDCVIIDNILLFLRLEFSALLQGRGLEMAPGGFSWIQPIMNTGEKWRSPSCPYLCQLTGRWQDTVMQRENGKRLVIATLEDRKRALSCPLPLVPCVLSDIHPIFAHSYLNHVLVFCSSVILVWDYLPSALSWSMCQ